MKKTIISLVVATIVAGAILTSLESTTPKDETRRITMRDTRQDFITVKKASQSRSQGMTMVEEWKILWKESEVKIIDNENRINQLRRVTRSNWVPLDEIIAKRLDTLERINNVLRTRLETYVQDPNDWETFRNEFNQDMAELGQGLNDIKLINKN